MLFPVINDTGRASPYCGPVAVAALTGTPITRVEKMIRRVRDDSYRERYGRKRKWQRKPSIRATGTYEIKTVLERLGCRVERYKTTMVTFGQFVHDTEHVPGAFLVEVTGHWIAVSGGHFADSLDPTMKPLTESDRRRIVNAWRVLAPETPREPTGIAKRVKVPKTPEAIASKRTAEVQKRAARVQAQVKEWEARAKRAATALKKLRPKLRRYEKLGVIE